MSVVITVSAARSCDRTSERTYTSPMPVDSSISCCTVRRTCGDAVVSGLVIRTRPVSGSASGSVIAPARG